MSRPNIARLNRELILLAEVSARYGIPTARVAQRLIEEFERPLPDVLPPRPEWVEFKWPKSGVVT